MRLIAERILSSSAPLWRLIHSLVQPPGHGRVTVGITSSARAPKTPSFRYIYFFFLLPFCGRLCAVREYLGRSLLWVRLLGSGRRPGRCEGLWKAADGNMGHQEQRGRSANTGDQPYPQADMSLKSDTPPHPPSTTIIPGNCSSNTIRQYTIPITGRNLPVAASLSVFLLVCTRTKEISADSSLGCYCSNWTEIN